MGLADFPSMLNRFFSRITNKSITKNAYYNITQISVMSLDVWSLWTFSPMDVLSHRRYVSGRFSSRTFVCHTFCPSERFFPPDVLSLQKFRPCTLCFRTIFSPDILSLENFSGLHGHIFVVSATCITISCLFCTAGRFVPPELLSAAGPGRSLTLLGRAGGVDTSIPLQRQS
jgi:hypothetical protein